MKTDSLDRRDFLKTSALAGVAVTGLSKVVPAAMLKRKEPEPQGDTILVTGIRLGDRINVYKPGEEANPLWIAAPGQENCNEDGTVSMGITLKPEWGRVHVQCKRYSIGYRFTSTGPRGSLWCRTSMPTTTFWEVDHARRPAGPMTSGVSRREGDKYVGTAAEVKLLSNEIPAVAVKQLRAKPRADLNGDIFGDLIPRFNSSQGDG